MLNSQKMGTYIKLKPNKFCSCEQGGYPDQAVQWVVENRVVSGGNFTANSFCMPYPFPNHGCKDGNLNNNKKTKTKCIFLPSFIVKIILLCLNY